MMAVKDFIYTPGEHEAEKASNSYLMSLAAAMAGLPLPIINLLATLLFYISNRKGTYFVRWHCTQALLSQFTLFIMNSTGFWWTIYILLGTKNISNSYIAYLLTIIIFNVIEFVATIYTAIRSRKGMHIEWWFYGNLTHLICKA